LFEIEIQGSESNYTLTVDDDGYISTDEMKVKISIAPKFVGILHRLTKFMTQLDWSNLEIRVVED